MSVYRKAAHANLGKSPEGLCAKTIVFYKKVLKPFPEQCPANKFLSITEHRHR